MAGRADPSPSPVLPGRGKAAVAEEKFQVISWRYAIWYGLLGLTLWLPLPTLLHAGLVLVGGLCPVYWQARRYRRSLREQHIQLQTQIDDLRNEADARRTLAEHLADALGTQETRTALQRDFNSMVAHEFRGPLAVIQTQAQLLHAQAATTQPVTSILESARHLSSLLRNLQALEQIEWRDTAPPPLPCDLDLLLEQVIARLEAGTRVTREGTALGIVPGDPALLDVVFTNLLGNALKYAPPHTPVRLTTARTAQEARLDITDAGRGMTPSQLQHVFERGVRHARPGDPPGLGLGLYLSQRICQFHDGSLTLHSIEGAGTQATVTIPAHQNGYL